MELEIAADKVGEVAILAREVAQEMTGAVEQMEGLVEALSDDEAAELVALLWVGRGDFEPEEWADAVQTARDEREVPVATYLLAQPQLADHLEAGLEAMGGSARDALDDATAS